MAVKTVKRASIDPLKNHYLLSSVFAFLQGTSRKVGYSISDIQVTEAGAYRITAVNDEQVTDIFKVLKILVVPEAGMISDGDFDESFIWEDAEQAQRNTLVQRILVLDEYNDDARAKEKNSLVPVSVWSVNSESGVISKVSGRTIDRELDAALKSEQPNTFFNFPVPYVHGMNPVIALSFITQNFTVRGWHSSLTILTNAHRYAMMYAPNLQSDTVLEELTGILKACIKIGLFSEKGDRVFLPRTRYRSEKTFLRKYPEYVNRTMKRTLYDFGTTL